MKPNLFYYSLHSILLISVFACTEEPKDEDIRRAEGRAPVAVEPRIHTKQVVAGGLHSCAIQWDNRVKCWGYNYGYLGLGDKISRGDDPGEMGNALSYVDLGSDRTAKSLALDSSHTCAILDNDRVKCWGSNGASLGLGDNSRRGDEPGEMGDALPYVDLGAERTAKVIAAGGGRTCALLDNNRVKCWGLNGFGGLGQGHTSDRGDEPGEMGDTLPYTDLGTGRTAKAIGAGIAFACAILDNDQVKCWGWNSHGQLGQGHASDRGDEPAEMGDALPYTDLGAGRTAKALSVGLNHSCAILDNDKVKCWGWNSNGALGLGPNLSRGDQAGEMGDSLPYVDLGTGHSAKALSASYFRTCAILDNDSVKCWGANSYGQLGLADTSDRGDELAEMGDSLPVVNLGTGRTAKAVSLGEYHACAILEDDSVKCWGRNAHGELGLGDTSDRGDQPSEMGDSLPSITLETRK